MLFTHRIPQKRSSQIPCSKQGQLWNHTMLLRALTSQAMKKPLRMKSEQPVHYFLSPWWKSFSLWYAWSFIVSVYALCLSFLHHWALWRGWIHSLGTFLISLGGKLLGAPGNLLFSRLNKTSFFSLFSQGTCSRILQIITAYSDSGTKKNLEKYYGQNKGLALLKDHFVSCVMLKVQLIDFCNYCLNPRD